MSHRVFDIPLKTQRKRKKPRRSNQNQPTNIAFWRTGFGSVSYGAPKEQNTVNTHSIIKEHDDIDLVDDNSPNNPMVGNLGPLQNLGSNLIQNKPESSHLSVFGSKFSQQQALKFDIKTKEHNKNNEESSTDVVQQSDTQNLNESTEGTSQDTGKPNDYDSDKSNDVPKEKNTSTVQNTQPQRKEVLKGLASDIKFVKDEFNNLNTMQMKSKATYIDFTTDVDITDNKFVTNSQIAQEYTQIETKPKFDHTVKEEVIPEVIKKVEQSKYVFPNKPVTKTTNRMNYQQGKAPIKQISTVLSFVRKPKQNEMEMMVSNNYQSQAMAQHTPSPLKASPSKATAQNITEYANATNYHKGIPKSFITHNAMITPDMAATLNPMANLTPRMLNSGNVQMNASEFISNPQVPGLMPGLAHMIQSTPGIADLSVVNTSGLALNMPFYSTHSLFTPDRHINMPTLETNEPLWQTNAPIFDSPVIGTPSDRYSPSDSCSEGQRNISRGPREGTESPDFIQSNRKRLSAFQRLGPVTQPKKPKMTINLSINKKQSVRKVVDKTDPEDQQKDTPVHLRPYVLSSKDAMVLKYREYWPWRKHVVAKKSVTYRPVRTVMIMEQEQMEVLYRNERTFFQITVTGYPSSWTKEDVLDAVLNALKDEIFIPCFIEHISGECKFLVNNCRAALLRIHQMLFQIKLDGFVLTLTITETDLNVNRINFSAHVALKKRMLKDYDDERKLKLIAFTLEPDVSHFIYFPLKRPVNFNVLYQLTNKYHLWKYLTDLDLSRNKLKSLKGFNLSKITPKLQHLDLSHNLFEKVTVLLCCRKLSLHSLKLEGNPLCTNYTDPADYVAIIRMMFPLLKMIDDVEIRFNNNFPPPKKYYCPHGDVKLVEKFIDIYFSLFDLDPVNRTAMKDLYDDNAVLTVTHDVELRYDRIYRYFSTLYQSSHSEEREWVSINGASAIIKHLCKWPPFKHDPHTFTVDVLHYDEYSPIIRISGVLKLTSEKLADDEHLLEFTRTVVLRAHNDIEYKICNEMVQWNKPTSKYSETAFQINTVKPEKFDFTLRLPIDEELKVKIIKLFMNLTELDRRSSERCLILRDWNFKNALEYFLKLLNNDDLQSLKERSTTPTSTT